MINEYITLLLNLPDEGNPSEPIAPGYVPVTLPAALQTVRSILFPAGSSRFYQIFLAFYYMNLLRSTNREELVYAWDPRITYDLSAMQQYFGVNLLSAPILSDSRYPMTTGGSLTYSPQWPSNTDVFTITQFNSTESVTIYSQNQQGFLNGANVYPSWTSSALVATPITHGATGNVPIGQTGLTLMISCPSEGFTATGGKTWVFSATAPIRFNFLSSVYPRLAGTQAQSNLINLWPGLNDQDEVAIWQRHFNPIYRFSGFLNTYVTKVQSIYARD